MKHCHCGLRHHFEHFRAKKLGILGVILMGLHILFHVMECLILPSILVALGGHFAEEPAQATDTSSVIINEGTVDFLPKAYSGFCFNNQKVITSIYWQQTYDEVIPLAWSVCE